MQEYNPTGGRRASARDTRPRLAIANALDGNGKAWSSSVLGGHDSRCHVDELEQLAAVHSPVLVAVLRGLCARVGQRAWLWTAERRGRTILDEYDTDESETRLLLGTGGGGAVVRTSANAAATESAVAPMTATAGDGRLIARG